jgi:exodeoxyribonuclease V
MTTPTLSHMQEKAVAEFVEWNEQFPARRATAQRLEDVTSAEYFYLGGYAGTGKSTILPFIVEQSGIPMDQISFCAPTGKAAKVMTQKMRQFGMSASATTIHKLIYRPKGERIDQLEQQLVTEQGIVGQAEAVINDPQSSKEKILEAQDVRRSAKVAANQLMKDLEKAFDRKEGPSFQFNVDSSVKDSRLIVVDEASMVGMDAADDLRSFGIPILAMGDPGQLPPIKSEPGFLNRDPDFFLTEIHRQAADNPIIRLATMIREGKTIKLGRMGDAVDIISRNKDDSTYDLNREAQVIVGTNRKRWNVTMRLRAALGYTSQGPSEGEPLIVCKNSRSNPSLINGTFVACAETVDRLVDGDSKFVLKVVDDMGNTISIFAYQLLFEENLAKTKGKYSCSVREAMQAARECEHVDFGHAITCHKAQGSQWDDVIVHDESSVFGEDSQKWLYTAVTRAANRLTVVI